MAEMWNHVIVRDARIDRKGGRDHPEAGAILMEFDTDQVYGLGSIVTLPDGTDVEVIGFDERAFGDEASPVGKLDRMEQVLKIGVIGGPRS